MQLNYRESDSPVRDKHTYSLSLKNDIANILINKV